MAAVENLFALLNAVDGITAEWQNTGGGCYAIVIPFGVSESRRFGTAEILVTDREDVFTEPDFDSDDDVWGFFVRAYTLDGEGCRLDDDDSDGWIYTTYGDAGVCASKAEDGEQVVDLDSEVTEVFAAILTFVDAGKVGNVVLPRNAV